MTKQTIIAKALTCCTLAAGAKAGPGGLPGLSPNGTHLGTIVTPTHQRNFARGDVDALPLRPIGFVPDEVNIAGVRP